MGLLHGDGFSWETPKLSPHTRGGTLGLPPSAQSPFPGAGKGFCPMHRAVPWQGLFCVAGEQDNTRIKPTKLFWSLFTPLVGSRPCCQLPAKKQEGRRAGADQGSRLPLPPLSVPCQDCTVPVARTGLAHITMGLAGVPGATWGAWGRFELSPSEDKTPGTAGETPSAPEWGTPEWPQMQRGVRLCWGSERGCAGGVEPQPAPARMSPFGGKRAGRQAGRGLRHSVHVPVPHCPQGLQVHRAAREKWQPRTALLLGKS